MPDKTPVRSINKFQWLWVMVSIFLTLFVVLFFIELPIGATGMVHPDFPSMLKSGPTSQPSLLLKVLSLLLGVFILIIFCVMLFIGIDNKSTTVSSLAKRWIYLASGAYIFVFIVLVFINWNYVEGQSDFFIGGFPLPTAIMLYGLTLVPLSFTLLYLLKFEALILSPTDMTKFEAILRSKKQREQNNSEK